MKKTRGIAFRLGAPVLAGAALIFMAVLAVGYIQSRETILREVESNARNTAQQTVRRIESVLSPVEKMPESLAGVLQSLALTEGQIENVLQNALVDTPNIYGAAIAFEPYGFDASQRFFSPYLSRSGEDFRLHWLGGEDYNYFQQEWYQVPRETGLAYWSEPYFDEGGGDILMCTYSAPFFKKEGGGQKVAGVVTADISLDWLKDIVGGIHILQSGYGFIISGSGNFIVHPEAGWVMNETIFSVAEARVDMTLRSIGKQMIGGESGFVPFNGDVSGKEGYLYFAPVSADGWSLGIFFPEDELMTNLSDFNRKGILLFCGGLLLLFLVVWLVARTITRPLTALSGVAREMATGNLEIEVPNLTRGGEVGVLAESLNYMKDSLKNHIRDLLETNAAKERIESELNIAREIQMGLVPKIFPPFPDITGLDLHALIQPAREVGGDLYDFYRIDDERICLVLGDVSGKGVPASLFMAVTMTLMKMTAAKGLGPHEILKEVNSQLSRDNDAGMFVTLFCGILNSRTGEFLYANGGHNPPVLLRNSGEVVYMEGTGGVLLGAMDDLDYEMKRLTLAPGEGIFIYSDGVTEAMDVDENLYSDERLIDVLSGERPPSSTGIVDRVMESVLAFAGDAPQADDITMMAVRFLGGESE